LDRKTESRLAALIRGAYFAMVGLAVFLCVRYLLSLLLPLVLGLVIAALTRPLSERLSRATGLGPRASGYLALLMAYVLLGAALLLLAAVLGGYLYRAAAGFPAVWRGALQPALRDFTAAADRFLSRLLPQTAVLGNLTEKLQEALFSLSAELLSALGAATAKLPDLIMTLFFTVACSLVICANYREITSFIVRQLPAGRRHLLFSLKEGTGAALLAYLKAYLLLSLIAFAELSLGFFLLDIDEWLPTAVLAAVLDLLPLVGTGAVLLPWSFLCLLRGSTAMAAGLLLLYAITVAVRGILEPRLVGGQLGLHPLVSLCAVYLGYRAAGMAGMLGAPFTAQLLVSLHRAGALRLWKERE